MQLRSDKPQSKIVLHEDSMEHPEIVSKFMSLRSLPEDDQLKVLSEFAVLLTTSTSESISSILTGDVERTMYNLFMEALSPDCFSMFLFILSDVFKKYSERLHGWTEQSFIDAITARSLRIPSQYSLPDEYYTRPNLNMRLNVVFQQVIRAFPSAFSFRFLLEQLAGHVKDISSDQRTGLSRYSLIVFLLKMDACPIEDVRPLFELFRDFANREQDSGYLHVAVALCRKNTALALEFLSIVGVDKLFSAYVECRFFYKLLRTVFVAAPDLCIPHVDIQMMVVKLSESLDRGCDTTVEILKLSKVLFSAHPNLIDIAIDVGAISVFLACMSASFASTEAALDVIEQVLIRRNDVIASFAESSIIAMLLDILESDSEASKRSAACLHVIVSASVAMNLTNILEQIHPDVLEKLGIEIEN